MSLSISLSVIYYFVLVIYFGLNLCLKYQVYIYLLLFFGEVVGADGGVGDTFVSWACGRQGVDGQSSAKVSQGQHWPCLTPSDGHGGGRRGHGNGAHGDLQWFSLCPLSP